MLGRTHRFHGYNSLRAVYRRGRTLRGPMLSLKYATDRPGRPYRVGIVVGRKVSKSAVVRNRIRRRLYGLVRTQLNAERARGHDLVFTGYDERLASIEYDQLKAIVADLLQKAGLL